MNSSSGPAQLTDELRAMTITDKEAASPFPTPSGRDDTLNDGHDVSQAFPIHRLPPEILSLVFHHVVSPRLNDYGNLDITGNPAVLHKTVFNDCQPQSIPLVSSPRPQGPWKKTVVLGLVCRAWRALLLNTPSVWTYLQGARADHMEEMLARSGTVPFTLNDSITPAWTFSPALHSAIGRMKELVLFRRTTRGLDDCLTQLLGGGVETPLLESLAIIAPYWSLVIDLSPEIFTLPRPALRHLTLLDCNLPGDCTPCFPNLLTLHMKLLSAPPARVVHDMLASSRELEVLWLYWFVSIPPEGAGTDPLDLEDVHLSHLSHLTMAFDLRDSVHLLSYLRYPKTAIQRFRFTTSASGSLPEEEWHSWAKKLVERLGLDADAGNSFTHAFIDLGSPTQSSMYIWQDDPDEGPRDNVDTIIRNATVAIDVCHSHIPDVNLFSAFCAAILLPELSTLSIAQMARSGHANHCDVFNRHPKLRHLQLEGDAAAQAILPMLTRSLLSVQSGNICFPNLRHLRLKNVRLRKSAVDDDGVSSEQGQLEVQTQILFLVVEFLRYRAGCLQELGVGFDTIGFYQCGGMEPWMEHVLNGVSVTVPGLRREVDLWR